MNELILGAPLLACAGAALFAAGAGRRLPNLTLGWLLAAAPLAACALFASQAAAIAGGAHIDAQWPWMPTLGLSFSLHLDGLSLLFALLVSGIGALVLVYAGYYFAPHGNAPAESDARFFAYMLAFMASMLGLVLAGDVVTLFVFWELTSITSFLLVAYKTKSEAARRGAFMALFVTGGGGIALLAGLIIAAQVAGTTDLTSLLTQGDVLRNSALYPVLLGLIALGAFTKSAQFPAHFWLPNAMSAPTPASAFLHSATMVKAGIYLMARLYPALGGTDLWFWLLSTAGVATMLTGAFIGLRQNDLKGLLAYSTISQLGALMMLIGQRESEAFKALIVGLLAHALYKGALFLIVGIVDHQTGTRDLRLFARMKLHTVMRGTLIIGTLAALSMGGLPPMFGFLAKETLFAATLSHELPFLATVLFPLAAIVVGALMLVQACSLILETFFGAVASPQRTPHTAGRGRTSRFDDETVTEHAHLPAHDAAPGMLLAPALLAAASLVVSVAPLFTSTTDSLIAQLIAAAAKAAYGAKVKVDLALFTGLNVPLALSAIAIAGGLLTFGLRARWQNRDAYAAAPRFGVVNTYGGVLAAIDRAAKLAGRLQNGSIRRYLVIMLAAIGGLTALVGRMPLGDATHFTFDENSWLRAAGLLITCGASIAALVMKRDILAILALGASGIAMALLIALEPSPDVALVQIVVDVLTTAMLLFALRALPQDGAGLKRAAPRESQGRNLLVAALAGVVMAAICFYTLTSRPRASVVTPYYEANSKPLTGSGDIVGAIVVDFRGFDTMIEITVFSMAGLTVFTLLRFAAKKHPLAAPAAERTPAAPRTPIRGIAGTQLSSFARILAEIVLPVSIVIGLVHMIYGHDQPGDGFTAGVIISLAVAFQTLIFGADEMRARLPWLRPAALIGAGLLTVFIGSLAPALLGLPAPLGPGQNGAAFFAPLDFGALLGLPLPDGFFFSTSWLFELAICLSVLGSAAFMIQAFSGRDAHYD
ncbi:MAG: proton-conducting transporter membrane subunit [Chloroflexi bacterium]|nr:proton-conducting transporter membrane subunit [Chloroflexota bacterium]